MRTLRLAVVQSDPSFGDVAANLDTTLALVPADADVIVLPELFASGYQFRNRDELMDLAEPLSGPTVTRLRDHAADAGLHLCGGWPERDGDRVYNSSVLVGPDGPPRVYRKVHLFWEEKALFAPGDLGFPVWEIGEIRMGMMICFDWVFPEAARTMARRGAQVLLHPSNLVLSFCPDAMITRCLENRVFAATANRVGTEARVPGTSLAFIGTSQICGPLGRPLVRMGAQGAGAATADVDPADADPRLTPRNSIWEDRRPESYDL